MSDDNKITWQELTELDPALEKLEWFVLQQAHMDTKTYCATFVWYDLFKPQMTMLVGFTRKARLVPGRGYKASECDPETIRRIETEEGLDVLRTRKAYDCAL